MVKAQEWLDKNYPKKIRNEIRKLDISQNQLNSSSKLRKLE